MGGRLKSTSLVQPWPPCGDTGSAVTGWCLHQVDEPAISKALTEMTDLRCLIFRRCGLMALPLAFLHEPVISRGARTRRHIRRQASGPMRNGVAQAARERERDDRGDMAGADQHQQQVTILTVTDDRVRRFC